MNQVGGGKIGENVWDERERKEVVERETIPTDFAASLRL